MEKIKSECFWKQTVYYFQCSKCGHPNENDCDMWDDDNEIECDQCGTKFLMSDD